MEAVLDRWYEGGRTATDPKLDYFKVAATHGGEYILRYNAMFDGWAAVVTDHRQGPDSE